MEVRAILTKPPTALRWLPLNLINGAVKAVSGAFEYATPSYTKDSNNFVHLRGYIKPPTTSSTIMCYLDNEFCPRKTVVMASAGFDVGAGIFKPVLVFIEPTGAVQCMWAGARPDSVPFTSLSFHTTGLA